MTDKFLAPFNEEKFFNDLEIGDEFSYSNTYSIFDIDDLSKKYGVKLERTKNEMWDGENAYKVINFTKKSVIAYWVTYKIDSETDYQHKQRIDTNEVFDIAKKFSDLGYYVMIQPSDDGKILWIDNKRFTQR